ncbi:hypothetical protein ABFS82_11G075700 [Erythranthe guttata]|uniref:BAG domain-containing protein n=1 Tax=Erythranthe guttata TaxID=4155 RepID=A0A022RAY6_ERYGU|nr:PREDICTED: uncharacterized protein LOC105957982 [Erythranthe guttata]EYU37406.1 hypothetical protein MIMGU_mgv1a009572mg [Erythranthe guttata]|eukprot:XP_012837428.1 PREDICTED: uncharacterized protein LOC105957982 [Erythranthe guttata]
MENPFFANRRFYQQPDHTRRPFSRNPSFRGVPVYPIRETPQPARPVQRPSEPKVVRIPVQFVGSEKPDRRVSALKIQKVFRGFLVRKYLKKIKDIKVQVDEIGGKLSNGEIVELVRRNEKERLRLNEGLMSLLIKLDSISGLDFGVRVCRKAVIRKAIALQERLDEIVALDFEGNGESGGPIENSEIGVSMEIDDEKLGNLEGSVGDQEDCGDDDVIDVGVDCEVKVGGVVCVDENLDSVEESAECVKERFSERDEREKANGGNDDSTRNREMMEKLMEDNEKMMKLMMQLLEKNESQTKVLNGLTHRVELLEKAFLCEKLRKKKKKMAKGGAACREE